MAEEKKIAEERYEYNLNCKKEFYEDIIVRLEQVSSLQKDGKKQEAETMYNNLKDNLAGMLDDFEFPEDKDTKCTNFDRSVLPCKGIVLGENNRILLRAVSDDEYDDYMGVSYENSVMKSYFKDEEFKEDLWKTFIKDTAAMYSIIDKKTGDYVGYCGIKNLNEENWELAMELLERYQHQGYGYDALTLMLDKITRLTGQTVYRSKVDSDNYASQGLMKKIGGKPNGIRELFLHGDKLKEFQQENSHLIDDKLIKVADEFGVEPIDLIGHVLEFRIVWGE